MDLCGLKNVGLIFLLCGIVFLWGGIQFLASKDSVLHGALYGWYKVRVARWFNFLRCTFSFIKQAWFLWTAPPLCLGCTIESKQMVIVQLYFMRIILHRLQGIILTIYFFLFAPSSCSLFFTSIQILFNVSCSLDCLPILCQLFANHG
jgi:hypothetical protein